MKKKKPKIERLDKIICRADEISTADLYAYAAINSGNFKKIAGVMYMINSKNTNNE